MRDKHVRAGPEQGRRVPGESREQARIGERTTEYAEVPHRHGVRNARESQWAPAIRNRGETGSQALRIREG